MLRKLKNRYHLYQARKAAKKFGNPHEYLKMIGVTGTDGKTTTTSIIRHILNASGLKAGYITSTAAGIGDEEIDTGFHVTTPDPWMVPKYLRMMVDSNTEYAVLEATSQGLHQHRFGDVKFDAAVVTNIREDHLDYHKTWENYAKAKFMLLEKLKDEGVAILNKDDERSAKWLREQAEKLKQTIYVNWATKDLIKDYRPSLDKTEFYYKGMKYEIPILGTIYNLENILQSIMLTEMLLPDNKIKQALRTYRLPSGRMETIITDPITVIVDFAHTPGSLDRALKAIKEVLPPSRRLITVFGCAGKRDKGRRRMGAVSARQSDITILTAEDPRSEQLADINNEIYSYARKEHGAVLERFKNHDDYALTNLGEIHAKAETIWSHGQKPFLLFDENNKNSRKDAIELALRLARRGDCVFVTGKGHEKSLAFGKEEKEYRWSDQEEAKMALKRLRIA
jgi:UDP-N-acetylmuramoyl-L-alanyl-D-glutamate--2,6-diaminopimelate ligase